MTARQTAIAALREAAYLLQADVERSSFSRALKEYPPRIREALSTDDVNKAEALYLEFAEALAPLASMALGLKLMRPDEARKFGTVVEKARLVRTYTDPQKVREHFADAKDKTLAIEYSIQSLVYHASSLLKYWDRLKTYTKVEKEFPHGPFNVVNSYGYRPEEYHKPLAILDEAVAKLVAAGFGELAYGKIDLVSEPNATWSAQYHSTTDHVTMNVTARNRFSGVHTYVHEFGHRYWFKTMTEAQRDAYEDAYAGTAKVPVTRDDRRLMWEAWKGSGFNSRKVRHRLPEDIIPKWDAYWPQLKKQSGYMLNSTDRWFSEERAAKVFLKEGIRYVFVDGMGPSSVTDYGRTNVKEDFAEVFAFHVLGGRLTDDAQARFNAALLGT